MITELDSELAEASKDLLFEATHRLPRKNADLDELEKERERNYKRTAWNNEYISLLNMSLKLSEIYGSDNAGLAPGNLIFMEPRL